MTVTTDQVHSVTAVILALMVTNIEQSLAFYIDGLGFAIQNRWMPAVACAGAGCH